MIKWIITNISIGRDADAILIPKSEIDVKKYIGFLEIL
jgi:hypothetical protein